MRKMLLGAILLMVVISFCVIGQQTLETVLARGRVIVGVNAALPGFGYLDTTTGEFSGFDIDYARAIAAAIGVDIEFVPLTEGERFVALQTGQIDVLIHNTTWTLTRDSSELGLHFCPTTFYDGQGFLVRRADGIDSIDDLGGASICLTSGTGTEGNLDDAFRERGLELRVQAFADTEVAFAAYEAGVCDCFTSDKSQLASLRSTASTPSDHIILPDTITREPLGPVVRHGNDKLFDIVKWVVFATFFAEDHGITQANVATFVSSNPEIRRFLGLEGRLGAKLRVADDWAVKVIGAVGNYGEIFARKLEPLGIERDGSLNALYWKGGLIYSPQWR